MSDEVKTTALVCSCIAFVILTLAAGSVLSSIFGKKDPLEVQCLSSELSTKPICLAVAEKIKSEQRDAPR